MTLLLIFHPIQILLTTKMPKNMLVVLLASSGVMAGYQLMDLLFPFFQSLDIMGKPSLITNLDIP